MSGIDYSIPLQARGVQADPINAYMQVLQIRHANQQQRAEGALIEERQEEIADRRQARAAHAKDQADEQRVQDIIGAHNGNAEEALPEVMAVNPKLGVSLQDSVRKEKAAKLVDVGNRLKAAAQLVQGATPENWPTIVEQVKQHVGPELAERLGPVYDENIKQAALRWGMTAVEVVNAEHNKLMEGFRKTEVENQGKNIDSEIADRTARNTAATARDKAEASDRAARLKLEQAKFDAEHGPNGDPSLKADFDEYKTFLQQREETNKTSVQKDPVTGKPVVDVNDRPIQPPYTPPPTFDEWRTSVKGRKPSPVMATKSMASLYTAPPPPAGVAYPTATARPATATPPPVAPPPAPEAAAPPAAAPPAAPAPGAPPPTAPMANSMSSAQMKAFSDGRVSVTISGQTFVFKDKAAADKFAAAAFARGIR